MFDLLDIIWNENKGRANGIMGERYALESIKKRSF
jgi:hypothetical protein